ncbi:MarR family winged helix-turn-helix transcriptional regulator [Swaminathania salitolerans]|uniref:HTH marR-type domain-containing protein n=1 Tax=Swaminathania salitolerans TaxID=182838 RepID=A0A511BXL8_9PROT|nr:MarR family transcriptional regulator [Swaminathania salitolerans]GBQ12209.1 MarR family transcriptional regulator [Swaminathania salitolerans LMG 21291]GEL02768.1 hypothetical protein SSA02_19310 [Swaminathania salitolerans]
MTEEPTERATIGRMINLIARRWRQRLDERLQPFDLTDALWLPMLEIKRQGGALHPKEIADALRLDKSTMVRTLRTLEDRGFVIKTPDEADRRAYYVTLTEEGISRLDDVLRLSRIIEDRVLRDIPDIELGTLRRLLGTIHAVLEEDGR